MILGANRFMVDMFTSILNFTKLNSATPIRSYERFPRNNIRLARKYETNVLQNLCKSHSCMAKKFGRDLEFLKTCEGFFERKSRMISERCSGLQTGKVQYLFKDVHY